MKKSEMLDIMLGTYTMYLTAGVSPKETFELMLEHMEEAGMLPPSYNTRLADGLEVRMLAWEPENDNA